MSAIPAILRMVGTMPIREKGMRDAQDLFGKLPLRRRSV
jgi:hypothetical protein